jgi:pimeloyl-ACP methyl ester carboxylesterase
MFIRLMLFIGTTLLLIGCNGTMSPQTASTAVNSSALHDWVYGVRYVGGREVDYGNGKIWVEQATVTTFIPQNPTRPPIVMVPGLGLSASMYTTTTDGKRKGWAQVFAEAGHPVYIYDMPEYSPSGGFDVSLYDRVLEPLQFNARTFGNPYATAADTACISAANAPAGGMAAGGMAAAAGDAAGADAGMICPAPLPTDVTTPRWSIYGSANLRAWVGIENGQPWSGTNFPVDEYSLTQFEKSFPYRWNDSGIEGGRHSPITGNTEAEALVHLYEEIGESYILMTHSMGSTVVRPILNARPEAIRALIGFEPAGLLDRNGVEAFAEALTGKPYLSLYGDNVDARGHRGRYDLNLVELVPAVRATGTPAGAIDLPAMGIFGNSHMMSQDTNNVEIAQLVIQWLGENVH